MRWRPFAKQKLRERQLEAELRFHLEQRIADNLASGMSPSEARRRGLLEFGTLDRVKDECRALHWETTVESLYCDFRYALRSLARDLRFSLLAILALGLGIGSATVIFSAVYGVMLDTFPYKDSAHLVSFAFHDTTYAGEDGREYMTIPEFLDFREQNHVFEDMNGGSDGVVESKFVYTTGESTTQIDGGYLTANTFEFLGVPPILGRWPTPDDLKHGAPPVFAMSYKLWTQQFNRDPKILNRIFVLNGVPRMLVAIMPPRFRPGWHDVWITIPFERNQFAADPTFRDAWIWPIGRLKPGVRLEAAAADLDVVAHQLAKIYPDRYPKTFKVTARTLSERMLSPVKYLTYPLAGAVALLILIACSNVANLMLARATVRDHEIAIRMSIGASRAQIMRQFLVESFILAAAGCLIGWAFANFGIRAMIPLIPYYSFPQEAIIELNRPVFLFALALTVLTTLVCGLVPTIHGLRRKVQAAALTANKGVTMGFRHGKLRSALVVSEVALSVVLLMCATSMMRSFLAIMHVDLGFDPNRILVAILDAGNGAVKKPEQQNQFFHQLLERVKALPGVTAASNALSYPTQGVVSDVSIPGKTHSEPWNSLIEMCSDGYFQTFQLPLLRGRFFTVSDVEALRRVAVINQTFARKYLAGDDPIGRTIKFNGFDQWPEWPQNAYFEVIGVTADTKNVDLRARALSLPEAYLPASISGGDSMTLLVRVSDDPVAILPEVRHEVWALNRNMALVDEGSLSRFFQKDIYAFPRFESFVMSVLGTIGTLLAAIGIFSVMAYTVSLRTREIGVRMALGAQQRNVLLEVLKQGFVLTAAGAILGVFASFGLMRLLAHQLWGVSVTDPWIYGGVLGCVMAVGLASCLCPARRAAQVDPVVALRYD